MQGSKLRQVGARGRVDGVVRHKQGDVADHVLVDAEEGIIHLGLRRVAHVLDAAIGEMLGILVSRGVHSPKTALITLDPGSPEGVKGLVQLLLHKELHEGLDLLPNALAPIRRGVGAGVGGQPPCLGKEDIQSSSHPKESHSTG